jgi:hypothetical protein
MKQVYDEHFTQAYKLSLIDNIKAGAVSFLDIVKAEYDLRKQNKSILTNIDLYELSITQGPNTVKLKV